MLIVAVPAVEESEMEDDTAVSFVVKSTGGRLRE